MTVSVFQNRNILMPVLGLLFFVASSARAQNHADTLRQKHNESVVIYGSSRPRTGTALKVERKPDVPSLAFPSNPVSSSFFDKKVPTVLQLQPVKPLTHIPVAEKLSVWNNLLTLGLGSRISPLMDYYYSGGKAKRYRLTVDLRHHSSFLNIKDYLPSPYTDSKAGIWYDRFFRYHILSFSGGYQIRSNRYYGYNTAGDTLDYDTKDPNLKQYYQKASFGVQFASAYRTNYKLHHFFRADAYYLSDKHGMSETYAGFQFDLHKSFKVTNIFNHQQLGTEGGFCYYQNEADELPEGYRSEEDYFARFMPYFDARYGMFSFKAGFNFQWLKQQSDKLHFYPYLHVNVNVAPGVFSFFAGVDGGLNKNSLDKMSRENPFLSSMQKDFRWENTKFEAFGGFRGNIARRFGFEFRTGYRSFSDMAYFNHDISLNIGPLFYTNSNGQYIPFKNAYMIYYTSGHVLDLSGSLTYGNVPGLDVWLKGIYHQYSLDNVKHPLYKPLFEMQLGVSYPFKKIKPWVEVNYMAERWAETYQWNIYYPEDPYYRLSRYLDVNIGADYHIDKQLSAFIRVTNLLNEQYFRFDGYPVAGLEVMVGIRYRF